MIPLIEHMYAILLDREYQRELFGKEEGFQPKGNAHIARCPFHGDTMPTMVIHSDKPEYFCFVCSKRGDWIEYLQARRKMPFEAAVALLAKEAEIESSPCDEADWRRDLARTAVLENAQSMFIASLWDEQGTEALHYLYSRGYSMGEVEGMALGSYAGYARTMDYLDSLGFSQNLCSGIFQKSGEGKDVPSLVFPYRDSSGRLMGLLRRSVGQERGNPYAPLTDLSLLKGMPFNLYRSRGQKEVIVVEGLFDALLLDQVRLKPVISVGKEGLSFSHIDAAETYGVRHFTLALGNGSRRREATRSAIERIREKGLSASVLPIPRRFADLDGYIRGTCLDHFRSLLSRETAADQWLAGNTSKRRVGS